MYDDSWELGAHPKQSPQVPSRFGIYRKTTATDTAIDGTPYCPMAHKINVFKNFIHHLVKVLLDTFEIQNEIKTIKYLAAGNNLHLNIEEMIRWKSVSEALNLTTFPSRNIQKKLEK